MPVEKAACNDLSVGMAPNMAREQTPLGVSQRGGARPTVALLVALLLVASVLAPVSTTAAIGSGDPASAIAAAGNTTTTTATTTTAGNDETATTTTTTAATTTATTTTTTTATATTTTTATATTTTTATATTTTTTDTTATTSTTTTTATVGNDESVTIRGTVTADGDSTADATAPAANDSVRLWAENGTLVDENRTDEEGRYLVGGEANRSYDLTYRQRAPGSDVGPRDGLPAAYAIGEVNASGSVTRNVSVSAASVLNVTVVAQNRTAVRNATVRLVHERDGATAAVSGQTDEQGRFTVEGRVGVEMAGNLTVAVEPPNSSMENRTVEVRASEGEARVVLPLNDTEKPTLRYDVAPNPVNVSESVTFDAWNTTDESGVRGVTWTINGVSRDARSVSHDFRERGEHEVTLSATDWAGRTNTTTITVTVVDERPPDPALTANATTVETDESVLFDASGTDENDAVRRYWWDFDGDGEFEADTTEPTVSYAYGENATADGNATASGNATADGTATADENVTYEATVMVVDAVGNRANASQQITVTPTPPTASFSVTDRTPEINQSVTFDASPSTSGAPIESYEWTFSEGPDVQKERSFSTPFADSGRYNVTLTVTDDLGRTDERTRTIRVPNKPPEADARRNRSAVVAGESVGLDASYSIDPDDEFAVAWNQTAGPNASLSAAGAKKATFAAPNVTQTETLRFELTVSDDHGANDTDEVAVVVAPRSRPNVTYATANETPANWTAKETSPNRTASETPSNRTTNETRPTPTVGETVTFRVNRSGQYRWDFDGDGTAEATPGDANVTNRTVTHRFDASGEYNVTLVDAVGREVVRNVTVVANETAANVTNANETAANETGGAATGGTGGAQGGGAQGGGAQGGGAGGGGQSGAVGGPVGDSSTGGSSDGGSGGQSEESGDASGQSDASASDARKDDGSSATVAVEAAPEKGAQNRVLASVEDAAPGEPATVDLPTDFGGNGSAFESVAVVAESASNFSLSVAAKSDRPAKIPNPGAKGVFSYLEVEERDATVTSAQFRFRVAADRLAEAGVSPDAVRLYRYDGGEWQTLATEFVGEQNGSFRFRAISPGFSTFAIGFADGSGSDASQQGADGDDASDGGDAPDQHERSDGPASQNAGDFGGVGDGTLLVGLFCAAIIGAALWGYLLS